MGGKRSRVGLSVALATFNDEGNLERCLRSVEGLADEIVVVDGSSKDGTVEVARKFGARVEVRENPAIFHINKQRAIDLCRGEWVLQLDADEEVSRELAEEIRKVVEGGKGGCEVGGKGKRELFLRHQRLVEERDGRVGKGEGEPVAFFVPRKNYFLGKFLKYGGVYPDGVIRLFKKGKARLPCRSVHEQYEVEGVVGWLVHDLLHYDSPNFARYWERNGRYAVLLARRLKEEGVRVNLVNGIYYFALRPAVAFLNICVRHKGFLDGWRGVMWAAGSGLTWARAWVRLAQRKV